MMITLHNDYHNTQAVVRIEAGDTLSRRRVRSIRDRLCGSLDCACGDTLGTRGHQPDLVAARLILEACGYQGQHCVVAV